MIMAMRYRWTHKRVSSARYRLIWCPRSRRRVLVGGVEERLEAIIAEVAAEIGAAVIEVEVMPGHLQLLAEVPPTVPPWRLVGLLQGRPSRLLRAVVRRSVEDQQAASRR